MTHPPVGIKSLINKEGCESGRPAESHSIITPVAIFRPVGLLIVQHVSSVDFNNPSPMKKAARWFTCMQRSFLIRLYREDLVQSFVWLAHQRPAGSDGCRLKSKQLLDIFCLSAPPPPVPPHILLLLPSLLFLHVSYVGVWCKMRNKVFSDLLEWC